MCYDCIGKWHLPCIGDCYKQENLLMFVDDIDYLMIIYFYLLLDIEQVGHSTVCCDYKNIG